MTFLPLIILRPLYFGFSLSHLEESVKSRFITLLVVIILIVLFFYLSRAKIFVKKMIDFGTKNQFFIVFAVSSLSILFAMYFLKDEGFSLKVLVSIFLLTFTSFIFSFYMGVVQSEKYIMKHLKVNEKPFNQINPIIKEIKKPRFEEITIESKKTNDSITFQIENLQMVEAQGNYCMFYVCTNGKCVSKIMHITMKAVQENLSKHCQIIRCHKSFIININNVIRVSGISRSYVLHFENKEISVPVSRIYQESVIKIINDAQKDILKY